MRMWIDTEFNEYRGALISMALVAEDGGAWYGVRFCDDPGWWVREHVMPHLYREPARDADLRRELAQFLAQYDSVHIVADWPGDIAHFCNFLEYAPGERIGPDRMTFEVRRDLPDTSKTSTIPHNALEDARALARGARAIGVATSVEDRARTLYSNSPRAYRGTRPLPWDEAPEATRMEFMERARGQIAAPGVGDRPMLGEVWLAFGEFEGSLIALPEYAAATEQAVKEKIIESARREGFTGTAAERMESLGWTIRRVLPPGVRDQVKESGHGL